MNDDDETRTFTKAELRKWAEDFRLVGMREERESTVRKLEHLYKLLVAQGQMVQAKFVQQMLDLWYPDR